MEILIDFPGGSRVDAHFETFTVPTDQPPVASAPMPFELFLASLATCAGIYAMGFCRQRGLSIEGIHMVQRSHTNPATGMVELIDIEIVIPPTFPEKYRDSLIRSVELCKVKKHMENPPQFSVNVRVAEGHSTR